MMTTDPIADMLTRIRNAHKAKHEAVEIPISRIKLEIAKLLKSEGYIKNFKLMQDKRPGTIKVFLKYQEDKTPAIIQLKRVSRPGRRVYASVDSIPVVKNGLGIAILSTSRGIMSDKAAKAEHVGGEVLCEVW